MVLRIFRRPKPCRRKKTAPRAAIDCGAYGRTKNTGKSQRPGQRKIRSVPRDQWTWCRYPLRSRLHCSQCGRRMTGSTRPGRRKGQCYTYYVCPWRESNPRDVHRCPSHVRAAVREDTITAAIAAFLDQFVFGHDRAAMLQAHLLASAAEAAARRDAQAAQLRKRIARNEASQKGLIGELAQLGDDTSHAATEYRKRIREHHTELYSQAAALHAQLEAITAQAASDNDPALTAELPYAPGFLLQAPDHVREACMRR
jgi:hypothetical protein